MSRQMVLILIIISTLLIPSILADDVSINHGGEIGDRPYPISGLTTEDEYWSILTDLGRRPMVIAFLWTTCPHCEYITPLLEKADDDWGDSVTFVMIFGDSRDDPDIVSAYRQRYNISQPTVIVGTDVLMQHMVIAFPTTFFIAEDGTIADVRVGRFMNYTDLEGDLIRALDHSELDDGSDDDEVDDDGITEIVSSTADYSQEEERKVLILIAGILIGGVMSGFVILGLMSRSERT